MRPSRTGKASKAFHFRSVKDPTGLRALKRGGKLYRGDCFLVWVSEKEDRGDEPAVFLVTGGGFRNAVSRNRARRRMRGCIIDAGVCLREGRNYLVECRPGAESKNYQFLVNNLRETLSKVSI